MLSNWTIVRHDDEISVVAPLGGPGGMTIKNAGRLEQRLLFALAEALICRGCGGKRTVPTGIDEAPTTTCKNCGATGYDPQ